MIRGYRSGFLTDVEYDQLLDYKPPQEGENPLNDIRLNLQETDYGTFLGDYDKELNKEALKRRIQDKLADEFQYIRCLASPELAKFLDFVSCKYMIANVITVLRQGIKNNANMNQFMEQGDNFNPLGRLMTRYFAACSTWKTPRKGLRSCTARSCLIPDRPLLRQGCGSSGRRGSGSHSERNFLGCCGNVAVPFLP